MTEPEWLTCEDPLRLLAHLAAPLEARKTLLLSAACCRRHWDRLPEPAREWAELAESAAEGGPRAPTSTRRSTPPRRRSTRPAREFVALRRPGEHARGCWVVDRLLGAG